MVPLFHEFAEDADRHAAGRFGKDAFGLGQQLDPFDDFFIGHHVHRALALGRGFQGIIPIGRIADRQVTWRWSSASPV